jgi:kinetochore protein NDC80
LNVPGTNSRQSMLRSQNANPLLQSTSKQNFGRTPLSKCACYSSIVVLQV